jgi:hypothetical protein
MTDFLQGSPSRLFVSCVATSSLSASSSVLIKNCKDSIFVWKRKQFYMLWELQIMYIFCSDVSEKILNFFYLQITFCTLYCELKKKFISNLQHRFAHGKQKKIIREVTYNICYKLHVNRCEASNVRILTIANSYI